MGSKRVWRKTFVMGTSFIGDLTQTAIDADTATVLPTLTQSMIGLIGISHGGYVLAKVPDQPPEEE